MREHLQPGDPVVPGALGQVVAIFDIREDCWSN